MYMEVEILKFDDLGRGIGYLNGKIIFVPKSCPGDYLLVKIVLEKKNFYVGLIEEIIKPSKLRKDVPCPYFFKCGGCDLMHLSVSEQLDYKLNKTNEMLLKNNIHFPVEKIIKSEKSLAYRNKVTFKVKNGIIGYYEPRTHDLIKIDECLLCKEEINNFLHDLPMFGIMNGEIVVRTNYKQELLVHIITSDEVKNIKQLVNLHKIVGVVKNDECIYGDDFFIDKVNDLSFKVSYNSFFQINPTINKQIFNLLSQFTKNSKNIIDLYSGVGTLSIAAHHPDANILGVEIVENAVLDASLNKLLNNKKDIEFICADTSEVIDKITSDFDTIILDPPRSGVTKEILMKIMNENIKNIIYISCDQSTLVRDLLLLMDNYEIQEFILLDMFSNTKHVESFVVLKSKN